MRYLTASDVIEINKRLVGPGNLRDFGLLESAVLRPQATVGGEDAYPDPITKAAALFHSLCLNHAFVDGNKRTAVVAMAIFLRMNGIDLYAPDVDLVHLALDTATRRADVDEIAGRIKANTAESWTEDDEVDGVIEIDEEG